MAKLKKELEKENELLLNRLEKLEAMLINKETKKQDQEEYTLIDMHKIIKVVSLYNGILNLKTSIGDENAIFRFNFFGDEQPIFYNDLVKAISIQQRFFKDGFCMILNKDVIQAHYLTDTYKNLLTKDQIDNFLGYSEQEINDIYPRLTEQQKITVLERIAYKINDREQIDMNKVDIVSNISKQNLVELANKLK